MALQWDYINKIITIPRADLVFTDPVYELDTIWFMNEVRAEISDETHIWVEDVYARTPDIGPIVGTTYAGTLQIINGWRLKFDPDELYSVLIIGSNNDLWDVAGGILIPQNVQVIPTNSAGLVVFNGGTGGTDPASVWNHLLDSGNRAQDELISAESEANLAKLAAQAADTTAEAAETAALAAQAAAGNAQISAGNAELAATNAQVDAAAAKLAAEQAEAEAEAAKLQSITNATLIQSITIPTTEITEIHRAHFNRRYWNQTLDTITIYDTDNVTPLHVFDANNDLSDITPQP